MNPGSPPAGWEPRPFLGAVAYLGLAATLALTGAGCGSLRRKPPPEPAMQTAELGSGYEVRFRQTGTGPDVVLLHGIGDSSVGWQFVEPALVEAGYRVLVWDALGSGRSEKPPRADYSILGHVKRLEQLLDQLGVRQAVVVGHSLGGSEALLFAQRNPEMTRGLFLIDPAAYREGAMGGRWFWNMPLLPEAILSLLPPQTVVWIALTRNFHDNNAISDQIKAAYLREARREGAINALIEQERQIVPRAPAEWEAGHRAIKAPTLVLWGEDDRMVPPAQGRRLTNDIAGARLVVLPATGHSAHLETPKAVLEQLLPFLREHASGTPTSR